MKEFGWGGHTWRWHLDVIRRSPPVMFLLGVTCGEIIKMVLHAL
jgi:hypothetical protein